MNRISIGGVFSPIRNNQSLNESLLKDDLSLDFDVIDEHEEKKNPQRRNAERKSSAIAVQSGKLDKGSTSAPKPTQDFDYFSEDSLSSCSRQSKTENNHIEGSKAKKSVKSKVETPSEKSTITQFHKNMEKDLSALITLRKGKAKTDQQEDTTFRKAINVLDIKTKDLNKVQRKTSKCISESTRQLQITSNTKSTDFSDNINKESKVITKGKKNERNETNRGFNACLQSDERVQQKSQKNFNHAEAAKVPSNIIEKLISDAVSFEFDAVRQQLYLQHFSLCRMVNSRLDEVEERFSSSNEKLYEIIQELMDENRNLRNFISTRFNS